VKNTSSDFSAESYQYYTKYGMGPNLVEQITKAREQRKAEQIATRGYYNNPTAEHAQHIRNLKALVDSKIVAGLSEEYQKKFEVLPDEKKEEFREILGNIIKKSQINSETGLSRPSQENTNQMYEQFKTAIDETNI
jgi:hypothetical protein